MQNVLKEQADAFFMANAAASLPPPDNEQPQRVHALGRVPDTHLAPWCSEMPTLKKRLCRSDDRARWGRAFNLPNRILLTLPEKSHLRVSRGTNPARPTSDSTHKNKTQRLQRHVSALKPTFSHPSHTHTHTRPPATTDPGLMLWNR